MEKCKAQQPKFGRWLLMQKKLFPRLSGALLFAFVSCCGIFSAQAADKLPTIPKLELLTGAASGSWYSIGAGVAEKFNEFYEGFPMTAIPGPGSIGNAGVVANGDAEIGMSYGPFLMAAVRGEAPYKQKYTNLRAIGAIQPTVIQLITVLDIKTIGDFVKNKVKATLGVNPIGNASTYVMAQILDAYGVKTITDIEKWGAKAYFADGASISDAWADRHVDMQMLMLNVPASLITQNLVTRTDGKLIGLESDIIKILVEKHGFQPYTIPAGTYDRQKEDCKTVALPTVFFTTEDADPTLIYNFTKALYKNKVYFQGVHSSFKEFDPEKMAQGVAIQLHPGAEKFYREVGLLK